MDYEEDFNSENKEDEDPDILQIQAKDDYSDLFHNNDEIRNSESFSSSKDVIKQCSNVPSTLSMKVSDLKGPASCISSKLSICSPTVPPPSTGISSLSITPPQKHSNLIVITPIESVPNVYIPPPGFPDLSLPPPRLPNLATQPPVANVPPPDLARPGLDLATTPQDTRTERENVDKDLDDDAAASSFMEYINSARRNRISDRKDIKKRRSCSRSPESRNKRSVSRSPDRRYRPSRSRSRDKIYRKARSRSADRRYRRSRSRSPDRSYRRSISRNPDRSYRSRSRSPERRNRRSGSRERRRKDSINLERNPVKQKMVCSRSPSNEIKSNKRQRFDGIKRVQEPINVLSKRDFCDTDIAILNYNENRVTAIMTQIFIECGGKYHLCDSFKMMYRFETRQRARVVYKLVNKFRTPLCRVLLECRQTVDTLLQEDSQETMFVLDIIDKTLNKSLQIEKYIEKELSTQKDKIDPYLFKTTKCVREICRFSKQCIRYHNDEQRRRNPTKYLYTPTVCSQYRLGLCDMPNRCKKCHSEYEFIFHPDKVHKKVCSYWYTKGPCKLNFDSPYCCINAHPETPEVLFNDVWLDLYIAELKHTYYYLVGAMHNLRFVNTQCEGVYVLLVTPSIYMIYWLISATQNLAKALKLDVNMVMNDTCITEKEKQSKVLLCTPGGVIRLLETQGVDMSLTLSGLILDDVTLLLHRNTNELETIGKTVMHSSPCLVAVADKVYNRDVSNLSSLLYTQFKIIGAVSPPHHEKDLPSFATIDSILSSSKNIRQDELSTFTIANNRNIGSTNSQNNPNEFSTAANTNSNASKSTDVNISNFANVSNAADTSDIISKSGSAQKTGTNKLTQEEVMLVQKIVVKYESSSSPPRDLQRSGETEERSCSELNMRDPENELLSKSASHISSSESNMLDEIGESIDLDIDLSLPQRNCEWDSSSEHRLNKNTHSLQNVDEIGESFDLDIDLNLPHRNREPDSGSECRLDETVHSLQNADEIGESFNLDIDLSLPHKNHERDSGSERRQDENTQNLPNAGISPACMNSSQMFMNGMFKVAIFGHEYVNVLPFYSGKTFMSKTPDNPYQVIKYFRYGAEIFKVQEYSIWNELISAQPHMIFLILGKNDISAYISPQELADRMVRIKNELEKSITNVRIVCFGLENRDSDCHWSSYQDKLNRCLGTGFDTLIFPTAQVDIGNTSYEAVLRVWTHMQGIIQDLQIQHIMLHQSQEIGINDMLNRYINFFT